MILFTDNDEDNISKGDRVKIYPPRIAATGNRYRTQEYGEGIIVSIDRHGAYVKVDGSPDNTWAVAHYEYVDRFGNHVYCLPQIKKIY